MILTISGGTYGFEDNSSIADKIEAPVVLRTRILDEDGVMLSELNSLGLT